MIRRRPLSPDVSDEPGRFRGRNRVRKETQVNYP